MKHNRFVALAAGFLFLAAPLFAQRLFAQNTGMQETPPTNFKKVSTLVKLPDWLPGIGTLYVDPSSLPVGPYLGYNRSNRLVNVIYMIPLKDFDEHKSLHDLGENVASMGLKVDHTSLDFNPGHPGLQEAHYHVTEWLISPSQQRQEMK